MTANEYTREVEWALSDLPWSQRRDLVAELRAHLAEFPADANLVERLGEPERYAAELRAAEHLERRRGPIAFIRARRPRNVILVVLLVVLVTLAIGAAKWVNTYQPLHGGNGASERPPGTHGQFGSDVQAVTIREGKPFALGETVWNTGRFTVRVLGVPFEPPVPWKARLLVAGPHNLFVGRTRLRPFHPFDLGPGQAAYLILSGVWKCRRGGFAFGDTGRTIVDFPVRYSFLWRTVTAEIPLGQMLAIQSTTPCSRG